MNFDIKSERLNDDAVIIALSGEVDLYTAPEFKQQLLEAIGQGAKEVVARGREVLPEYDHIWFYSAVIAVQLNELEDAEKFLRTSALTPCFSNDSATSRQWCTDNEIVATVTSVPSRATLASPIGTS